MLSHRSPDNPKKLLIKRLLALEGDWIAVPGEVDIHKIPKVQASSRREHSCLDCWQCMHR